MYSIYIHDEYNSIDINRFSACIYMMNIYMHMHIHIHEYVYYTNIIDLPYFVCFIDIQFLEQGLELVGRIRALYR